MPTAARRLPTATWRWGIAIVAVVLLLVPISAVGAAAAADRTVSSGSLTWGVKQSFRSYVTGFIAQGEITTGDGAGQAADNGAFDFTGATGTVRADGGADLTFSGSVRFTGHHGALDVTIADPRLSVDAQGAGHLEVQHTFDGTTRTVRIADVTGASVSVSGDTATVSGARTTLTRAGMAVFSMDGSADGSFYAEGDELDPAGASLALEAAPTDPTDPPTTDPTDPEPTDPPTTDPEPTDPPTTEPTTPPTTQPTPSGRSGQLVWGVKASFRSYVGGPIAQGTVTVSDHASTAADGSYVFPQRTTSATPPSPRGTTTYRGQVAFKGHHGEMDLALRNPRVVVTSSTTGRLVVDARPTGATGFTATTISSLDLTRGTRTTADGSVTISGVPVTLSRAGSTLFARDGNSLYPAGTVMDPVTFTIGADTKVTGPGGSSTTKPTGDQGSGSSTDGNGGSTSTTTGTDPAPTAAPTTAAGAGSLSWGVRRSFRDYITGPIAHGSISVSGGAASSGGAFTFPQSGAARSDGGADYRGAVTFRGHGGILTMSFANPSVSIDSARSGSLTAQVSGRRITVATLNLGAAARSESGGATVYSNVPATLTAAGSSLFAYNGSTFYPADTAMDPVTFTVGSAASSSGTNASSTDETVVASRASSTSSTTSAAKAASATEPKLSANACVATGRDLTWGFKESFRSYVSGSIAHGDWSTKGGASYTTPHFVWAKGEGRFDEKTRTGSVTFPGTIAFSGHDGKLNTTLSDPQIRIEGDTALVVLDASGASMDAAMEGRDDTTQFPNVPFVEIDLSGAKVETADGTTTISVSEAPTTLTPQGEAAFSTYEAGTQFDPISFTITAKSSCLAPTKAATSAPGDDADDVSTAMAGPASGGGDSGMPGWVPWVGGAGFGAAAAVGATLLVSRRRLQVAA